MPSSLDFSDSETDSPVLLRPIERNDIIQNDVGNIDEERAKYLREYYEACAQDSDSDAAWSDDDADDEDSSNAPQAMQIDDVGAVNSNEAAPAQPQPVASSWPFAASLAAPLPPIPIPKDRVFLSNDLFAQDSQSISALWLGVARGDSIEATAAATQRSFSTIQSDPMLRSRDGKLPFYQSLFNPLFSVRSSQTSSAVIVAPKFIEEAVLVREILGMIRLHSGEVFRLVHLRAAFGDNDVPQFHRAHSVTVPHLSQAMLDHQLSYFLELANKLVTLSHFSKLRRQDDCLVLQAFKDSILQFLIRNYERVMRLEQQNEIEGGVAAVSPATQAFFFDESMQQQLQQQRRPLSIMSLRLKLEQIDELVSPLVVIIQELRTLYAAVDEVDGQARRPNGSRVACLILDFLFEMLQEQQLQSGNDESYALLQDLFCSSVQPYLHLLDQWIFEGTLQGDAHKEFMIIPSNDYHRHQRNPGRHFWSKAFLLQDCPRFLQAYKAQIASTGKSITLIQFIESEFKILQDTDDGSQLSKISTRTPLPELFRLSLTQAEQKEEDADGAELRTSDLLPHLKQQLEASFSSVSTGTAASFLRHQRRVPSVRSPSANRRRGRDDLAASQQQLDTSLMSITSTSNPYIVSTVATGTYREIIATVEAASAAAQAPVGGRDWEGDEVLPDVVPSSSAPVANHAEDKEEDVVRSLDVSMIEAVAEPQQEQLQEVELTPSQLVKNILKSDDTVAHLLRGEEAQIQGSEESSRKVSDCFSKLLDHFEQGSASSISQLFGLPFKDEASTAGPSTAFCSELDRMIDLHLLQHVKERCSYVQSYLLDLLLNKCQLLEHLNVLRSLHLMHAGDVMHNFALAIFERLDTDSKDIFDMLDLNDMLQESISLSCLQFPSASRDDTPCSVLFDPAAVSNLSHKELALLQAINLDYRVNWPLNMIIDKEALVTYNEVFHLLLQIKRAAYVADRMHLPRLTIDRQNDGLFHKVSLVLHKLKHFVNNVQQFFLVRILDSVWQDFLKQLSYGGSKDFDSLRQHHDELLAKLRQRVLLKKAPFMIDQIRNNLQLCILLYERYDDFMTTRDKYLNDVQFLARQDEHAFHLALEGKHAHEQQMLRSLQQIEREFDDNMKMLMMIVQKLMAMGGSHHLRGLELSLNYNHFFDRNIER